MSVRPKDGLLRREDQLAKINVALARPAPLPSALAAGRAALARSPDLRHGVRLGFTLAQSGMVATGGATASGGGTPGSPHNLLGALLSAVVVVIATITKLTQGA